MTQPAPATEAPADQQPAAAPAEPQPAPTPNVMPQQQHSGEADHDDDGLSEEERRLEHVRKLRSENKSLRERLKVAEPVLKEHQEREEANKTELQRAQEALAARDQDFADLQIGYTRLELAAAHNIPPDDIDLIGSGSREDMEARATRLGALHAANNTPKPSAPPSDRPVERLRPGAAPEPPTPADDSYPESWKPAHLRQ